jgi:hypothetical protein
MNSLENPFGEKSHQLPDGAWVSLRIVSNPLHSKWTCFWLQFITGKMCPAWYRVFPSGTVPPEWKPLKSAGAVDKQTGVGDYDSDKDAEEALRENEGKIGAARKLQPGRYIFQSKIRVGAEDVELTSIEFKVERGLSGFGRG